MQSKATTVKEYLSELPPDRRAAIRDLRKIIKDNLPAGYKEVMQYGMIGYVIPLRLYPDGYLGDKKTPLPYIGLASQKNHLAIYLTNVYADKKLGEWFKKQYKASGKKIDMGKSCVRFKTIDNVPLELIGQTVAATPVKDLIALYSTRSKNRGRKP